VFLGPRTKKRPSDPLISGLVSVGLSMSAISRLCLTVTILAISGLCLPAYANTITFEGLPDSTIITTQYRGLIFSNAIILTAGISLNEFEFPPYSGVNVLSDNGGPMSIVFSVSVSSFGAYFTYAEPLTLMAYNMHNVLVASIASPFSNNEALSGDTGSSPNEFLQLSYTGGISRIVILGDPNGGSFTMDNATYTSTVPEPVTSTLFATGLAFLCYLRRQATSG
jgi:hypothetical protein